LPINVADLEWCIEQVAAGIDALQHGSDLDAIG
jgi:hypothetical protein